MIVEPDFYNHWKTDLLVSRVAEERLRLISERQPEHNRELTGGYPQPELRMMAGYASDIPPECIQPEAAPLWLQRLWAHCHMRKQWRFPGMTPGTLKSICKAPLPPTVWRDILLECVWIEVNGTEIVVHEWDVVNASLIQRWNAGPKGGRPKKETPNHAETGPKPEDNREVSDRTEREKGVDRSDGSEAREQRAVAPSLSLSADASLSTPSSSGKKERGALEALRRLLVDTATVRITQIFGKRRSLKPWAAGELWSQAERMMDGRPELERTEEDWQTLEWFYRLPAEEGDRDLAARLPDGDKLAANLPSAMERAAGYAKKKGWAPSTSAGGGTAKEEPAGWREWLAGAYPEAGAYPSFWKLPKEIRSEFEEKPTTAPTP